MTATETSTAAPATTISTVTFSPRISHPSTTATIGFTYAYVETSEMGADRRSQTYEVNPMKLPTTIRYARARTESVVQTASPISPETTE
jgi:hypothetical protein